MKAKSLGIWDIGLTKLSVLSATLFLVSVWPAFASWVTGTYWAWFLGAAIIFGIKPMMKFYKK